MQQLVLKIRESHYQLFLKFLNTLEYVKIVQPSVEPQPPAPSRYDFSDLAGKLEWKGDAVVQQRLMRDEW
ncbi:MAG: hypothetical protein IT258_15730 [Saprospiraceae bacterium]|nr:hypothetical protein [Saprospiraceae bacterium]